MMEAMSALAGSAEAWYQDQRMFHDIDLRGLLPSIHVPTVILAREASKLFRIESARFLAERLPEARIVEFEGPDSLPWVGDSDLVLDEIQEFMTGNVEPRMPAGHSRRSCSPTSWTRPGTPRVGRRGMERVARAP